MFKIFINCTLNKLIINKGRTILSVDTYILYNLYVRSLRDR